MNKTWFTLLIACALSLKSFAQVGINTDNSLPDPSAILDVKSSNSGALIPRMTMAQIAAIPLPANGLMAYCTTNDKLYIFVASLGLWKEIPYAAGSITPPFTCGIAITVNHTAGEIAPVSKAVSYGTVTNIPGEENKCWITRNLGASQQAATVDDATEPSAGWYWQFNRARGYMHDGSSVTPVWNTTAISENSNWEPANDPCGLELGSAWRIPVYTEWYNVDLAGGWSNWNGPWNSGLKLHASGYISYSSASGSLTLSYRGSHGYFWTSVQQNNTTAWALDIATSNASFFTVSKGGRGCTIRCIREN